MAALPTNGAATRPSIFPQLSLNAELWCDTGGTPIGGTLSLPQVFRGDRSPHNTSEDRQGGYSNPQLTVGTEGMFRRAYGQYASILLRHVSD